MLTTSYWAGFRNSSKRRKTDLDRRPGSPARRTKKALGAGQETSAGWVLQWMAEWVKDCRPAPNT